MKSKVIKRSAKIRGRHTSVSLEDRYYVLLKAIAASRRISVFGLYTEIDEWRRVAPNKNANFSSACREWLLEQLKNEIKRLERAA